MKSNKKLGEICMEIYREMYKQADPPADFDKLIKSGETKNRQWFMNYYLPMEKQEEITANICKKHKLTKQEIMRVYYTVFLGASPTSVKG